MRALSAMLRTVVVATTIVMASPAFAQSTEERFQDLFTTAGYATAFGAALGAACLSFTPHPESNLQYVAIGASLGFIGGSILGTYVVFSPMFATNTSGPADTQLALASAPRDAIALRPTFDLSGHRLRSLEGAVTLLQF